MENFVFSGADSTCVWWCDVVVVCKANIFSREREDFSVRGKITGKKSFATKALQKAFAPLLLHEKLVQNKIFFFPNIFGVQLASGELSCVFATHSPISSWIASDDITRTRNNIKIEFNTCASKKCRELVRINFLCLLSAVFPIFSSYFPTLHC